MEFYLKKKKVFANTEIRPIAIHECSLSKVRDNYYPTRHLVSTNRDCH